MKLLELEIHNTENFTKAERKKFEDATKKIHKVVNSKEFRSRFLSLRLEQTNGKSNIEIYQDFMSGRDKFNKVEDGDIDVYITMFYSFKNTIGYTYPSTWYTWVNRKFFSKFDEAEIAGNIIHEYLHNMGYGHKSARDHMSVPYAGGYLVRDMIKELMSEGEVKPERIRVCKRNWKFLWFKKTCYWVDKQQ